MRIEVPVAEAVAVAVAQGMLPPFVHDVRAEGSTLHLVVDAAQVMGRSGIGRFLGGLAGQVPVTARLTGWADGVVTVAVTAESRGLPLQRFMPMLEGQIQAQLRRHGLPDSVVDVRTGAAEPVIAVDVQRLVDAKVAGVTVTAVELRDAVVHVTAAVGPQGLRLR